MSMPDRRRIGFDRTIAAEWLDAAVARVMTGEPTEATRKFLWEFLEDVEPGTTNNSSRGKTLTVLTRIWVSVPKQAEPLKRAALECVATASGEKRIGVHWAMVAGTHPFFFDVATHVGKLLKLHGQANRSQIKRRMTETWGDRSTLERTIQHVLRSMAQWGLLRAGEEPGSLSVRLNGSARNDEVASFSCTRSYWAMAGVSPSPSHRSSGVVPVQVDVHARDLMRNSIFRVQRQGDQSDFVELAPGPGDPFGSESCLA